MPDELPGLSLCIIILCCCSCLGIGTQNGLLLFLLLTESLKGEGDRVLPLCIPVFIYPPVFVAASARVDEAVLFILAFVLKLCMFS